MLSTLGLFSELGRRASVCQQGALGAGSAGPSGYVSSRRNLEQSLMKFLYVVFLCALALAPARALAQAPQGEQSSPAKGSTQDPSQTAAGDSQGSESPSQGPQANTPQP